MKRGLPLLLALLWLAGPSFATASFPATATVTAAPTAEEAAANLEKALRGLRTFQARFDQYYYSASVTQPLHERGELYLKSPDLMRWQYKEPQAKVFLYAGGIVQAYLPEDKQLTRSRVPAEVYESDIVGIFLGGKSFRDLYVIEDAKFPTDKARVRQIKLTPRAESDYSHILLEIDERTWLLRRALFYEWTGTKREFQFSGIRTNPSLPKGLFELKVPAGTEVIDETGDARR